MADGGGGVGGGTDPERLLSAGWLLLIALVLGLLAGAVAGLVTVL